MASDTELQTGNDVMEGMLLGKDIARNTPRNAKHAANVAKGAAKGAANAARSTAELAKIAKNQGAKAAGKHVASGAKNAAKSAGRKAGKAAAKLVKGILLKLIGFIGLPVILVALMAVIIAANTPAMFLNAIGAASGEAMDIPELENETLLLSFMRGWAPGIFASIKTFYYDMVDGELVRVNSGEKITQEELDELNASGEYDQVIAFYADVTQCYLDEAYDDRYAEITDIADEKERSMRSDTSEYDAARTMASMGGNPFTGIDYANIIAGYAVTDDFETGSLVRFRNKMHNGKKEFLRYELTEKSEPGTRTQTVTVVDTDETGAPILDETGMPKTHTEEQTVAITVYYDEVTLIPFSPTDIFGIFGYDSDSTYAKSVEENEQIGNHLLNETTGENSGEITNMQAYEEYYITLTNKMSELGYATTGANLSGTSYGTTLTASQIEEYLNALPAETSKNRKEIIKTALNVVGRIPYSIQGVRSYPYYGWNSDWGKESGNAKHPYIGMDCSGFVQWVYRNALCDDGGANADSVYQFMGSTAQITGKGRTEQIDRNELKPGDLGVKKLGGSDLSTGSYNHVGIYMGNNTWVHCSGSANTVVVSKNYSDFHFYFRAQSDNLEKDNYWKASTILSFMPALYDAAIGEISDDELLVVATTLHAEYTSDNGFRACAEAVYHKSRYEKKSMYETVIQKNYLTAYTQLYVTHTKNPNDWRASSAQYEILKSVMNGDLVHFPSSKYPYPVMYFNTTDIKMTGWRANGHIVETIGNVVYFYCDGVTYDGYGGSKKIAK